MRKNKSMSSYIWKILMQSFIVLTLLVVIINVTVFSQFKKAFFYEQLENESEYKQRHEYNDEQTDIHHFLLKTSGKSYVIEADGKAKSFYKNNWNLLERISTEVQSKQRERGSFIEGTRQVYYFVEELTDDDSLIFFKIVGLDRNKYFQLLLVSIMLIGFSYFIAKYMAMKISKPIRELEHFSEEISKKHWQVQAPLMDTLEFQSLSNTLNKTKQTLEIADKRDREFLQSTSHDLKTPVMVIKGYAQAMMDGVSVKGASAPEVIVNEADRLERKITQLLRLNTLDYNLENEEKWDNVSLSRVVQNVVSKLEILNSDLTWHFTSDELTINGDSESLLIAFENILENQLRYAEKNIWITIEQSNISIANDGPKFNINPELLFDQYQKNFVGQNGLGLTIAKKVIDGHHGKISAHNIDRGVEFNIEFKGVL